MSFEEFKRSLSNTTPPEQIGPLLKALWYDGKDNWETAHEVAQDINTRDGSWIHAYLHRKEGDAGNASYWYHRADRKMPGYTLQQEWEEIVKHFLSTSH